MHKLKNPQKELNVELLRDKCRESNSRIYGFILYTKSHPYVVKTLKDQDLWNALDEISGPNWPIFSVKPKNRKSTTFRHHDSINKLEMMVPTSIFPCDNIELLSYFGITDMDMLPCFMAFIWDDNGKLKTIACKIASEPEKAVYKSLEEIVEIISKIEAQIPEQEKNSEVVFQKVEKALKMRNFKYVILDAIRTIKELKDFIGLFGF